VSRHLPANVRPAYEVLNQPLPEAGNIRGMCALPNAPFIDLVFIAHQRPKSHIPATQIAQGWVFTNVLTLAPCPDLAERGHPLSQTLPLDSPNQLYADPSDVVVTPDGRLAFVACAGADTVLVVDVGRFRRYLGKNAKYTEATPRADAIEDLAASRHYVIAKLPTQANPRRLGLSGDGKTLVVSNFLADSLTVIDAVNLRVMKQIPLDGSHQFAGRASDGSDPRLRVGLTADPVRRGEILFNSAKLTFQGQFSCASCHPNGGADGLNWDLPRDGIGNFKNTKSLLGVKDTAPYGWLGASPTLADRVKGTLRTVHRYEPSEEEVHDLVAYLESLPPPRSAESPVASTPHSLTRGKALFEGKARCAVCHSGPAGDDGKIHDVGTGTYPGEDRFNTPSLRGLSQSAPYLHDGRAATLEDIFTKHNPKQRHGDFHRLTADEIPDLLAYLRSW
jgi:cytochrome c